MVCAWTGAQNRSTIKRLLNQNVFITEKTLQRISLFPAIRLFNNHKYEMHAEWVSLINSMWLNRTFLRPNHIAFKWFWFRFHFLTKSEPTPALLRSLSISQRKILSMATQCAAFLWINIKIMLFFFFSFCKYKNLFASIYFDLRNWIKVSNFESKISLTLKFGWFANSVWFFFPFHHLKKKIWTRTHRSMVSEKLVRLITKIDKNPEHSIGRVTASILIFFFFVFLLRRGKIFRHRHSNISVRICIFTTQMVILPYLHYTNGINEASIFRWKDVTLYHRFRYSSLVNISTNFECDWP